MNSRERILLAFSFKEADRVPYDLAATTWPDARNLKRWKGLRQQAIQHKENGKIVFSKGLCAGLFEMHQRARGMENAMLDPFLFRENSDKLIGKLADLKILFHSCGNVRPLITDLIEMGVDILNPLHVTATGIEPVQLKKDFGRDIVFWGGGVDTQHILPTGKPEQVKYDVKRNIEALAPGGGFVFSTIHNIQAEVPPQNIIAMTEALKEFGR